MTDRLFDAIDWQRPWLAPFLGTVECLRQTPDWRTAFNAQAAMLRNHRGLPIQFVPQTSLPSGVAYEAFISDTGSVPTRENLHDFFNAVVWLSFPRIKCQLNALQAQELARSAMLACKRGKLRDAATIFDENAALLVVRDARLISAFQDHRWHELFVAQRGLFGAGYEVWLFGHALMEKLSKPFKAITAHAWPVVADAAFFEMPFNEKRAWLDDHIGRQLEAGLATSCFTPLPVLGIPGWWGKQDEVFYQDSAVFRSKRSRSNPK